jgi:tetratricopeptide (TPR) repeat protein
MEEQEPLEKRLLELARRAEAHLSTQTVCFSEEADNYGFSWAPSMDELLGQSQQSLNHENQYLTVLQSDPVFHNPGSYQLMAECYGLEPYFSFQFGSPPLSWNYKTIQQERNRHLSTQLTIDGIDLCRKSRYGEALSLLKQAIELLPTNVDALVAIGACYANMGSYRESISQLELALSLKPNDSNALLYLNRTQAQLAQQEKNSTTRPPIVDQSSRSDSSRRESFESIEKTQQESSAKDKKKKKKRKHHRTSDDNSLEEGHKKKKKKDHKKNKKKRKSSSPSSSSSSSSSPPPSPKKPSQLEEDIHPILSRTKSSLWG